MDLLLFTAFAAITTQFEKLMKKLSAQHYSLLILTRKKFLGQMQTYFCEKASKARPFNNPNFYTFVVKRIRLNAF